MNSLMSILMSASSLPNMNSASALASSVFPTPVGPRKMNEPIGPLGILEAGAGPADGLRDDLDRLLLADDPAVERLLHVEQPLGLLRRDPGDRDAGPHRDDLGDLLLVDRGLVAGDLGLPVAAELLDVLAGRRLGLAQARGLLVLLVVDRRVLLLRDAVQLLLGLAQRGRRGRVPEADARRGLVDQVDGLVGQVAVRDVATSRGRRRP